MQFVAADKPFSLSIFCSFRSHHNSTGSPLHANFPRLSVSLPFTLFSFLHSPLLYNSLILWWSQYVMSLPPYPTSNFSCKPPFDYYFLAILMAIFRSTQALFPSQIADPNLLGKSCPARLLQIFSAGVAILKLSVAVQAPCQTLMFFFKSYLSWVIDWWPARVRIHIVRCEIFLSCIAADSQ